MRSTDHPGIVDITLLPCFKVQPRFTALHTSKWSQFARAQQRPSLLRHASPLKSVGRDPAPARRGPHVQAGLPCTVLVKPPNAFWPGAEGNAPIGGSEQVLWHEAWT